MAVSDDLLAGNVINVGDATLRNAGGAYMASCQYAWHNGRGSWKAVQGRHGTDGASKRVSKSVGWTVGGARRFKSKKPRCPMPTSHAQNHENLESDLHGGGKRLFFEVPYTV